MEDEELNEQANSEETKESVESRKRLLVFWARMIGWLAHNIENKQYCDKIVRPAGKYVGEIIKEEE